MNITAARKMTAKQALITDLVVGYMGDVEGRATVREVRAYVADSVDGMSDEDRAYCERVARNAGAEG